MRREVCIPDLGRRVLDFDTAPPGTRFEIVVNEQVIHTYNVGGLTRESAMSVRQDARRYAERHKAELWLIIPSQANAQTTSP